MTTRTRSLLIVLGLLGLSLAIFWNLAGCSSDKKQITPPVVGPAAGSGPVGGGETQKITIITDIGNISVLEGEEHSINIVALVENSIGQPMPDGTPVYWTVDGGDSSVSSVSNGASEFTLTIDADFEGCQSILISIMQLLNPQNL